MKTLKIGTRDSLLARIQTDMVVDAIKAYDPDIYIEIVAMKTTGDRILDVTLDKFGGKGLFVKELDEALLSGKVDITVHSFKDMPMIIPEELPIVATSAREDVRDAVLMREGETFTKETVLGCSSLRRRAQLEKLGYPPCAFMRGNVQTRMRKRDEGACDGLVLAAAGIKRLGIEDEISYLFSVEDVIPAACQGIIAVQAKAGEDTSYLSKFHDEEAHIASTCERAFVRALDGGCSSPIGAYAKIEGERILLSGMFQNENGITVTDCAEGLKANAEKIGIMLANKIRGKLS